MVAFANGVSCGADGLELDVHASKDGRVVVVHDETLDRTTRLRGPVRHYTADELAAAGVPELRTVLDTFRDVRVIVEMKVNALAFGGLVVDELRRAGAVDRVCVGAFRRAVLRAVRAEEPALATSAAREEVRLALYRSWLRWPVMHTAYAGYQIGVQVWTVNDETTARRMLSWGVDALITDRPDLMVPLVREHVGAR